MIKFINVHTHSDCKNSNICIKNNHFLEDLTFQDNENQYFSIGLHPWDISKSDLNTYLTSIKEKLKNKKIIALGEIGLDKAISTNFSLQKKIFIEQLLLAESLQLAVIIHCVKAYSDILEILKKEKITTVLIFHNFTANQQIFNQLMKYNSFFSFGKILFSKKAKISNYFNLISLKRIFLETDDENIPIEDVYLQASKIKKIELHKLKKQINLNFKKLQV